jgi:hypothetical protein
MSLEFRRQVRVENRKLIPMSMYFFKSIGICHMKKKKIETHILHLIH